MKKKLIITGIVLALFITSIFIGLKIVNKDYNQECSCNHSSSETCACPKGCECEHCMSHQH